MSRLRLDETQDHTDLMDRMDALEPRRLRMVTLVHQGVDEGQEQWRWDLGTSKTAVLGRDPGAGGVELLDPGSSRRHAEIRYDAKKQTFVLRDLESRNGTFLDGARVQEAALLHGSLVRIADSLLVFSDVGLPDGVPAPSYDPDVSPLRAIAEAQADLAARSALSILILGPTGAGKEVMARRIHEASGRSGPMVAVNCAALNRELIASELFGHAAGAFSGATHARGGLFKSADGGTIFLDEIADLPLDQQPALLRTLQEKTVRPVGSDKEHRVDVRVVAATHRDLDGMVESEHFRQDLYARLTGYVVRLPGLSERREEILPFFTGLAELEPDAVATDAAEALLVHEWPQNIREVQHVATQTKLFLGGSRHLELSSLPADLQENLAARRKRPPTATTPKNLERPDLVALLERHQGNVATIAKELGKHRAQVYRWLKREGIDPDQYRPSEEA